MGHPLTRARADPLSSLFPTKPRAGLAATRAPYELALRVDVSTTTQPGAMSAMRSDTANPSTSGSFSDDVVTLRLEKCPGEGPEAGVVVDDHQRRCHGALFVKVHG